MSSSRINELNSNGTTLYINKDTTQPVNLASGGGLTTVANGLTSTNGTTTLGTTNTGTLTTTVANITSNLNVTGTASFSQGISTTTPSTFGSTTISALTVTNDTATSTLHVSGLSTLASLNSQATSTTTLTTSGLISANGGITSTSGTNTFSAITTGAINATSGLFSTTLSITGLLTASGGITSTTSSNTFGVTTIGAITGTSATFSSTLSISGLLTANNGLTVTSGSTSTQDLTSTTGTFSGLLTAQNGFTISSGSTTLLSTTTNDLSSTTGSFSGIVSITNTTSSTSVSTGALNVIGDISTPNLSTSKLKLWGTNSKYTYLQSNTTANNTGLTLPNSLPVTSGSYLISDTSGNLSFTNSTVVFPSFTYNGSNNVSSASNITGLSYTSGSFDITVKVDIIATTNLSQIFRLSGVLSGGSGWNLTSIRVSGDQTGIVFTINSSGQIQYTSLNYTGFSSLTFTWVTIIPSIPLINLNSGITTTGTPSNSGTFFNVNAATFNDTNTIASGTATQFYSTYIGAPSLTAMNTSVTTTTAATLFISGAPVAGTNESITNSYALLVNSGLSKLQSLITTTINATTLTVTSLVSSGSISGTSAHFTGLTTIDSLLTLNNGLTISSGSTTLTNTTMSTLTATTGHFTSTLIVDSGATLNSGLSVTSGTTSIYNALALNGTSSGTITIATQANSGTYSFNLPTTSGTAGQILVSQGGGSPMTWSSAAVGSVTSVGLTAPSFLTVSNSPITTNGNITLTYSGTALPITSGGTGSTTATGSGSAVLQVTPTLITPIIGSATGTSLTVTGNISGNSITSTVSTGTQPLNITSTTQVTNLNSSYLEGATFESPLTIGSTTPNTGAFTTVSLKGSTSGTLLFQSPNTFTSYTFYYPNSLGTSGQVLTSQGASSSTTWTTPISSIALTVPSFLSISNSPLTANGTLAISYSGTALPIVNGGTGSTTSTGSGSVVLQVSPSLTTPNINIATGTSLTLSSQFTSTLSTGTPAFVIASTTVIPNLNASLLNGNTFAIPSAIGSTTPNSGSFTSLNSSSLTVTGTSTLASYSATSGNLTGALNMNSNQINNLATPSISTDAATKGYVDSVAQGLSTKSSVVAATTQAQVLSTDFTNGSVIDSITLATGNRILIKNQVSAIDNGIYTVNATGSPSRSVDLPSGSHSAGVYVFVEEGTVNISAGFICTNIPGSDVIGTNNITFTQFSGAGSITAGTGLTKTGNTLSVNALQTQITQVGILTNLTIASSFSINGSSSGIISVTTQANSGTYNFNLPITSGTSGQVLTSQGNSTAQIWTTPITSIALTVPSFLSITNSPLTANGTLSLSYSGTALPIANGGTGGTTSTGSGSVVLQVSPSLTTPNINIATGTSLSLSSQFTSTLATGTPAFVIASTTVIPNLNASLLNGSTFAIPSAIGNTTPNTGAFTTLALNGSTSGVISILPQAASGTYNLNLPVTAGTSGQMLLSGGGSTNPMTWLTPITSIALTVPAFLSISNSPLTANGTIALSYSGTALPIANGGTGSTTATGSGSVVLQSNASLTTPNINIATGTSLSLSSQFTSTLATGTPALVISSTTVIPNLNAGLLNGATFLAPNAIGSTTPNTGAFTSLSASGATTLSSLSVTGTLNMNSNQINNLATPSISTDAATKGYVDSVAQGLSTKASVVAATTQAQVLTTDFTNGSVIDGITLATGNRILIKNQVSSIDNGIYTVNATGSPSRSVDLPSGSHCAGVYVFVEEGTVNISSGFICTDIPGSDIVGTNNITFTQFSGAGEIIASTGLTKVGNTLSINSLQTQITQVGILTNLTIASSYNINGSSSGSISIITQANSGTYNFNLPITSGSTGQVLTSQGNSTAQIWTTPITSISLTTPAFLTVSNSPLTANGTISIDYSGTALPIANGGTGSTSSTGSGYVVLQVSPSLTTPNINIATGTSLSLSSQFTSTLATGTPAFVIASTTVIPNLNASLLNGSTFAIPSAIGSTTPNTGSFTTLALNGSTSGFISILPQASSGTYNLNLPVTSGTSGQMLLSGGGSANPMTWLTPITSIALTVPSFLSISNSPLTANGTITLSYSGTALPIANGGTGSTTSTGSGSVVLAISPSLTTPNLGAATGTSLSLSSQFTSTLATGTPAFVITSTTVIPNLNASLLNGSTFAIPSAIGSTTPNTGSFTSLSSTSGSFTGAINMNSNQINNLATPSLSTDAATKGYVDGIAQGLSTKASVVAATTQAQVLSTDFTNGSVIDGITLATGNRILIKNQASQIDNGIYTVNATGSPSRSVDLASGSHCAGVYVFVEQGTVNISSGFICTDIPGSDVIGTNNITFTQFSGAGEIIASTGLTKVGNTLSVNALQTQITQVGTLTSLSIASSYNINGSSSGIISVTTQSASGTYNLNLPTTSGSSGQMLLSGGGSTNPMTWLTPISSIALTVPSFLSIANSPLTANGTLALSYSGTALPIVNGGTGSTTSTGSGSVVLQVSPSLTTPNINAATGTSLTLSSQFTSTLATGTPAFVIASTTVIPNLNASLLNGSTFAIPSAIGSTTPNTGAFTSVSLNGSTSGIISIIPQSTAGTYNFNLPITAGTNGQVLTTQGGSSNPMIWTTPISSIALSAPAFLSVSNSPLTANGTISITYSGTALPITSGGTGSTTATGSGQLVLATSPSLTTPNIGAATGTSLSVSGSLTSTVATGTSPLIVSSTTNVANLNASSINGNTFASPGVIGGTTPNTSTFTQMNIMGSGTGTVSFIVSNSASSYNFNIPNTAGTAGQILTTQGGVSNVMTWTTPITSIALTVPTFLSVSNSPLTANGTLSISYSGTALPILNGGTGSTTATGSGSVVLAISPSLTTPNINVATGTSLNLSSTLTASTITSTVAIGTAPLSVTSTTVVPNLNSSYLNGSTFGAPSAIGSITPNSATFTAMSITGSTSGVISLLSQAVAGTYNWNYPITAGTLGQALVSGGGSTTAMSWTTLISSIALSVPAFLSVTNSPLTANGTIGISYSGTALPIANGGTGSTTATGSGSNVLANTPTLITPNIGAATGTSLSVSGSLTSTVSTGTAPLIVSSSTNVANLNASSINGNTFANPGSIGGTTPNTATFTTLTVTSGTYSSTLTVSGLLTASNGFTSTASTTTLGTTNVSGLLTASNGLTVTSGTSSLQGMNCTSGSISGALNMNSNQINNVALPTLSTDVATKGYVDTNTSSSTSGKTSVQVATTTSGTLTTSFANGSVIDGVTLVTGQRILIKNQASAIANGIYVVNATGAPTRSTDLTTGASANGVYTSVIYGTVNAEETFICTSASGSDVVGTNNLTFNLLGGNSVTAGTGLTNTAGTLSVNTTQTQITQVGTLSVLSVTGTATVGSLTNNGINMNPSASDIFTQMSFSLSNNTSSASNVTGLSFSYTSTRSFTAYITVVISATTSLYAYYTLQGIYNGVNWYFVSDYIGNNTGLVFTITSSGQVQYTSLNYTGFTSGTLQFRAMTINI